MDVTPRELREIDFRTEWKGYHRDDVDDLLERAATTIEAGAERTRLATEQAGRVEGGEPPTRETEDMLRRTLVLAQRTADEAIAEAKVEAQRLVGEAQRVGEEAEASARQVTSDAHANARRVAEGERERLEAEVLDLGSRRDALLADVEQLETYAKDYRSRLQAAIERDLDTLASRNAVTDMARPTLHEVELPGSQVGADPGAGTAARTAAPESDPPGSSPGVAPSPGAVSPGPRSGPSYPPAAVPAPAPVAVPAPVPGPAPTTPAAASPIPPRPAPLAPLSVADRPESVPSAASAPAPAPVEPARAVEPVVAPAPAGAPLEAEVLDDDAFFASLREAVRDDTPLGPRGDDVEPRAEHDEEIGRFGNVFKRRR